MWRNASLRLGRVFGFEVRLDVTWFIIFGLISWMLAGHYFPSLHPGWTGSVYWSVAVITALLFFGSVLAHELAHSFVSRAYGVSIRDITLFFFGGVAQMEEEPKTARGEFLMAIAGPAASLAIAGLFGAAWLVGDSISPQVHALSAWMAGINAGLALFNLLPGFPLDGGRVFRSIIWHFTGDFFRATRIATRAGRLLAYAFIVWGMWQILTGRWTDGLWIAFVGWFLESAAVQAARQAAFQQVLKDRRLRDLMLTGNPRFPPDLTLEELVDEGGLTPLRRVGLVASADKAVGLVTSDSFKRVPRNRWSSTSVREVMTPLSRVKTVSPEDDPVPLAERMANGESGPFVVMENGRLIGIVTRDFLIGLIRTRLELGLTSGSNADGPETG